MRNVKMHSRPGRWPLEAAKRLEARAHAVRNRRPQSGWRREDTPKGRPQRRNTAPPKARAVRSAGTLGRLRRGARRPRAVRETGRCRRSPEGVKGRGQREALRSPGIPGQRSAGRYEDPNEAGSATSELVSSGGREAAGAPRTRSEAKSAGAEHRASVSAGRCEGVGRPC